MKSLQVGKRGLLIGLAILLLIAFSPCLKLGFVNFDDAAHLIQNPATAALDWPALKLMWTQDVQRIYIPLTTLSFAIERSIVGLNPFAYHLDNVLLHLANSILVFLIALRLNIPLVGAFFAGAIFGFHPMRVESVAWVTERKDVLCALFYLLACYQWVIYRQHSRRHNFILVHLFCALSLLAKPMAISLPLVLLSLDWFLGHKINLKTFKDKAGIFILCVALGWVTYQHHVRNPIDDPLKALQLWVSGALFYWQQFFLPFNLNPIYPIPSGHQLLIRFIISAVVLGGICWSVRRYRSNGLWVLAVLFYAGTIFFILRFDDRSDIHWVADRFMYIPSIGICWWLGSLLSSRWRIGLVVIAVLSLLTFRLIPIWKDSISLWSYVIKQSPNEMLAYNNRGDAYMDLGKPNQAADDYTRVIDLLGRLPPKKIISRLSDGRGGEIEVIKPWHLNATEVKFNRGLALGAAKRFDEAIADFNEVIEHYPHFDKAYYQRAFAFEGKGDIKAALTDYSQCLNVNPQHSGCFAARGNYYNKLGQWYEALADYNQALKVDPSFARVYGNRAIVYLALGLPDKALADFNQAIAQDKGLGEVYFNRSVYYYERKDYRHAMEDVLEASRLGVLIPDKYYQDLKSAIE